MCVCRSVYVCLRLAEGEVESVEINKDSHPISGHNVVFSLDCLSTDQLGEIFFVTGCFKQSICGILFSVITLKACRCQASAYILPICGRQLIIRLNLIFSYRY